VGDEFTQAVEERMKTTWRSDALACVDIFVALISLIYLLLSYV
jgi:hypothetical protein